jgi:hypothetical protein
MNKRTFFAASLALLLLFSFVQSYRTQAAPLAQLNLPPTPTPGPDGRILYIAIENDSVWRIAAINGISIDEFRKLNPHIVNDVIIPGQAYLIGYAGPSEPTAVPGIIPTQAMMTPTPTAPPGWGILCVLLYNDLNGDSMREESEPSIPGGEISVSNRQGSVSLTAQTPSGGVATTIQNPTPKQRGYTCFDQLLQGEYLISVAAPEGYNRTTELNQSLHLEAGQTTEIAFGAQANSELEAQTAIIPESPRKSPMIGIIGGALLIAGIGLGIYATLLRRAANVKSQ